MSQRQYLLDTSVLLHIVRGKKIGTAIDAKFQLNEQRLRPQLCVVTYGEIWAIAARNEWGAKKRQVLENAINELPPVDIHSEEVVQAYVDIQLYSQRTGRPMGQNDIWIAAAAKAVGAHLLACDGDFDHLYGEQIRGEYIDQRAVLKAEESSDE